MDIIDEFFHDQSTHESSNEDSSDTDCNKKPKTKKGTKLVMILLRSSTYWQEKYRLTFYNFWQKRKFYAKSCRM